MSSIRDVFALQSGTLTLGFYEILRIIETKILEVIDSNGFVALDLFPPPDS
jgi:hypothetical protein